MQWKHLCLIFFLFLFGIISNSNAQSFLTHFAIDVDYTLDVYNSINESEQWYPPLESITGQPGPIPVSDTEWTLTRMHFGPPTGFMVSVTYTPWSWLSYTVGYVTTKTTYDYLLETGDDSFRGSLPWYRRTLEQRISTPILRAANGQLNFGLGVAFHKRLRYVDLDNFPWGFTELPDASGLGTTEDGDWLLSLRYTRQISKSPLKATILYTVHMGGIFYNADTYSTFRVGFSL